jgi:hypothetical protein
VPALLRRLRDPRGYPISKWGTGSEGHPIFQASYLAQSRRANHAQRFRRRRKAILAKQIIHSRPEAAAHSAGDGDYEQLYFDASKVKGYDDVQAHLKTGEVPKDIIDLQNTKS